MDFPWLDILRGMGFPIIGTMVLLTPIIVGALIGHIIRLFKNIFHIGDDDK